MIDLLADTGSPRSFVQESRAKDILRKHPSTKISSSIEKTRYKCSNNQDIQITCVLRLTLKSGYRTAKNCNILLVSKLSQNVTGRDILQQLGIHLTATKPTGKTVGLISDTSIEQNILKWTFKKIPTPLCTPRPITKPHG